MKLLTKTNTTMRLGQKPKKTAPKKSGTIRQGGVGYK